MWKPQEGAEPGVFVQRWTSVCRSVVSITSGQGHAPLEVTPRREPMSGAHLFLVWLAANLNPHPCGPQCLKQPSALVWLPAAWPSATAMTVSMVHGPREPACSTLANATLLLTTTTTTTTTPITTPLTSMLLLTAALPGLLLPRGAPSCGPALLASRLPRVAWGASTEQEQQERFLRPPPEASTLADLTPLQPQLSLQLPSLVAD